jgi:hypothetical protein
VRTFTTKVFARFARKNGLDDHTLREIAGRSERGLIDADLGGGVIKQRVARRGEGRSGGLRTIILFRAGDRAVFAYGFAKNERDNIDARELAAFRSLATVLLSCSDQQIADALGSGALMEVGNDEAIS